jgi:Pentapeptide repeats (8 copies)
VAVVPDAFKGEEITLVLLIIGAFLVVCLTGALLWLGPRVLGGSHLRTLKDGKERADAEAGIRDALLKTLGIFGSVIAATAVAFSYIDKVNTQNEGTAAQTYFDAIKNLQSATSEEQKALSLASIAAIARNSRNLTPMAMDLFATYIRSSHRIQSSTYQLEGLSEGAIPLECRNIRGRFPVADVEVIINAMSTRSRSFYDVGREWNLSGLDLHSVFFASGFGGQGNAILFTGSNLSGGGFQNGSDLTEAHFEYADLACAAFGSKTKLANAHFLGTDLRGAALSGVDLTKADLTDADLRVADLTDSTFAEADLRNVKMCRNQLSPDALKVARHTEFIRYSDCF